MHFTQEDYIKIENWLHRNSVKDTEFQEALPFTGKEIVTVVQDGHNRKVNIQEFINQLYKHGVEDFLNVTNTYRANNITLKEAIRLIPAEARKEGQVITFLNTDGNWEIYQFIGKLNQWNNPTLWNNPFDWEKLTVDSILPDEEDLTKSAPDAKGNAYLSLKDRKYEPDKYSGLGRKILRRRVVEIEDPVYGTQEKNLLLQGDFAEDNTVYVVRYDFTLNGQDITLPDNSYIEYEGGSISDGNIIDRAGGLNRVVLKKNIVNGKNILTQEMVSKSNTIYEIRYGFDLNDTEITIPNGCVLDFQGGSLNNGKLKEAVKVISTNDNIFNKVILNTSNEIIKASWWVFSGNEQENSEILQCIFDTAFHSGGATILFGNKEIKFSNTVYIKTKSSNSYVGNHIIVKGTSNDFNTLPILNYTGSNIGLQIIRGEEDLSGGGVLTFENIAIRGDSAEYLIYSDGRVSSVTLKRVGLYASNGTCFHIGTLWTWSIENCCVIGKKGVWVGNGTSAYISNLFMSCSEVGMHLTNQYVHISNIFGDFCKGRFCEFRYCTAAISQIATESTELDTFIHAEYSQLNIQNAFLHKIHNEEHSIFSGSQSSIQVINLSVPDLVTGKPARGYINTGISNFRVVIDRLYSDGTFLNNNSSLDNTCGTTIKYYAKSNFSYQMPAKRESTWFRTIDGTSIEENSCLDGYSEKPLFPKTRVILGMQDKNTAVENVYSEDGNIQKVGVNKEWQEILQTDDIFINSRPSAGYPYFAWAVKERKTNFRSSDYLFVPFITTTNDINNFDKTPFVTGSSVFDTTSGFPYWKSGNSFISPFVKEKRILSWYNEKKSGTHYFLIGKVGRNNLQDRICHLCGTIVAYYGGNSDRMVYTSMFIQLNSSQDTNSAYLRTIVENTDSDVTMKFSVCTVLKDGETYVALKYENNYGNIDSISFMGHIYGYEGLFTDINDDSITELETLALPHLRGTSDERNTFLQKGDIFFDTTIKKPLWYMGNNKWVDATGADV